MSSEDFVVYLSGEPAVDVVRSARYRVDGRLAPGVTSVIDDLGLRADYSMVDPVVLAQAAERGTRVHSAIAAALGGLGEASARERYLAVGDGPYFDAFLWWRDLARVRPVAIEKKVVIKFVTPAGRTLVCAGRLDLFAEVDGIFSVIDFKCRPCVANDGLQTFAYREGLGADGARRFCVELRKVGRIKLHPHNDDFHDRRAFFAALVEWYGRHGDALERLQGERNEQEEDGVDDARAIN